MTRSKGSPASICFFTVGLSSHLTATVNPVASFELGYERKDGGSDRDSAKKPDFLIHGLT